MVRALKWLLLLAFLAAAAVGGWLYHFARQPLALPAVPFSFSLKPGTTVKAASHQLSDARLLPDPWSFAVIARILGKAQQIKAGDYELSASLTPLELIETLTKGQQATQLSVQFLEGQTFAQMRKIMDEHAALAHDSKSMGEAEILHSVGASETAAEGLFFPDTYLVIQGTSDLKLLKRAYQRMQEHLKAAWQGRGAELPYTQPYEALIMASIIEKETAQSGERAMIAAVFLNRLKLNMRLQTDPTVIYGMGERYDGNIRKKDLTLDTPYNTYTRTGLPPTPIAMPGLESLKAALNPASSKALYFVSRGNGTHEFSENLTQHNRAVAKYQK
jgi:UPF0755 protein